MGNRHMKICSMSLVIRKGQIKTKMRYYLTLVWTAIINKSTDNKCWRGCGQRGTLVHFRWECRLVQPWGKTVRTFLKKLKLQLPCDSEIPLSVFLYWIPPYCYSHFFHFPSHCPFSSMCCFPLNYSHHCLSPTKVNPYISVLPYVSLFYFSHSHPHLQTQL